MGSTARFFYTVFDLGETQSTECEFAAAGQLKSAASLPPYSWAVLQHQLGARLPTKGNWRRDWKSKQECRC
jgi:hypothetical protein